MFINDGNESFYILEGYTPGTGVLDGTIMPNIKMISPDAIVPDGTAITYNETVDVAPSGGANGDIWYNEPSDILYKKIAGAWTILTNRVVNQWYQAPVENLTDCPLPPPFSNVAIDALYQRNNCISGETGTTVEIKIAAGVYTSYVSQADADNQAQVAAQDEANTTGTCLINSKLSTLEIDYLTDVTSDLCFFVQTPGLAETGVIATGTAETPSGPLQVPNDGRDPSQCYILSSDKLTSATPAWRFAANLAYFISKYIGGGIPSITFRIQGRDTSAVAVSLSWAARDITEGVLVMNGTVGARIPGVSFGSSVPTTVGSNIGAGADGTVGTGVGAPVLDLIYTFGTNAVTTVTY